MLEPSLLRHRISSFYNFDHLCFIWLQTAVVPHVSLDVHHADFGQLQDPNAVAQKVQFFSLWVVALETLGGYLPFTKSVRKIRLKKKRVKRVFLCFLRKMSGISVFPETMFPMGTDHLHGKTANSGCEIKFFAPFRLGCFRRHELWFKASRPRCNSVGFLYVLVLFSLCGYTLQRVVWPPLPRHIL